jgi:hypothetical protein
MILLLLNIFHQKKLLFWIEIKFYQEKLLMKNTEFEQSIFWKKINLFLEQFLT